MPGPDLVVTALGDPAATARRGTRITVTDTVQNIGTAAATAALVRYYLSLDAVKDSGDAALNGVRGVGPLAPEAMSTGTVRINRPGQHDAGCVLAAGVRRESGDHARTRCDEQLPAGGGSITIGP